MDTSLPAFSKHLFWDVDRNRLHTDKNRLFIIERVVTKGTDYDWQLLKAHYGMDKLKEDVTAIPYLDPKTLNFLSVVFHISKEDFKCYTRMQSRSSFWDSRENSNRQTH